MDKYTNKSYCCVNNLQLLVVRCIYMNFIPISWNIKNNLFDNIFLHLRYDQNKEHLAFHMHLKVSLFDDNCTPPYCQHAKL